MRCNKCGSEWKAAASLTVKIDYCPFCKAPLHPTDNSVKETLRWIVQDRGVEIYQNGGIIVSILSDLVRDDEKNCRIMKTAVSAGAAAIFFDIIKRQEELNDAGRKLFVSLLSDCGFAQESCNYVFDVFAYSIDRLLDDQETINENYIDDAFQHTNIPIDAESPEIMSVDKEEGLCVQYNKDGSVTKGIMKNGTWNGRFEKTYKNGVRYKGTYKNGRVTGVLTFFDEDGTHTVGYWQNGNWNGRCRTVNTDGSIIEGIKIDGIWNGDFTKSEQDGSSYIGAYVDGNIEGKLIYEDGNGNCFECEYHDGNWNGIGKYMSKNGILTGLWVDGEVRGKGRIDYSDGRIYEGGIVQLQRDGKGEIRNPSSNIILEATFKEDEVDGRVVIRFPDGNVYKGEWDDNIDGYGTFEGYCHIIPGHISYSGNWKEGRLSGRKGQLTVVPERGMSIMYAGEFALGKACGEGFLYSIEKTVLQTC